MTAASCASCSASHLHSFLHKCSHCPVPTVPTHFAVLILGTDFFHEGSPCKPKLRKSTDSAHTPAEAQVEKSQGGRAHIRKKGVPKASWAHKLVPNRGTGIPEKFRTPELEPDLSTIGRHRGPHFQRTAQYIAILHGPTICNVGSSPHLICRLEGASVSLSPKQALARLAAHCCCGRLSKTSKHGLKARAQQLPMNSC